MQAWRRPTPMSGYLGQPGLALLRGDGRQRPLVVERRHGGNGGGDLRSRHHQVELGQLGGIVGDVPPGQRRRGVLRVVLQEDSGMGHHGGGGGRPCGRRLTFSKGVCLAFRPLSLPTLAGRQARFRELCEPPPSRPCRVPGSLWKVSALFSAILKEKAPTLTRRLFRRRRAAPCPVAHLISLK